MRAADPEVRAALRGITPSFAPDERAQRSERANRLREEAMKHISPLDKPPCRMPRLLNERREKYLIIDQMFEYPAMYDRILVQQIALHGESDTKGSGLIVMPETTKQREKDAACLGIIVGAGLQAMDELRSNGSDLGHIVAFVQWAVYRLPVFTIAGRDFHLLVLKAGDIVADCDLFRLRNEHNVRIVEREVPPSDANPHGSRVHVHVDEHGKSWYPQEPFTSEI
jgi:co-chaperonin GroES (HSP10)